VIRAEACDRILDDPQSHGGELVRKYVPEWQGKDRAFARWLLTVYAVSVREEFPFLFDLVDPPFRDWFDDEMPPTEAFREALKFHQQ
jgi:hypothetical protein